MSRVRTVAGALGACLVLASSSLFAQTGSLNGRVTDSDGQTPLPGAQVTLTGPGLVTSTDRQGEFLLGSVPAGTHTIEVSYVGRAPTTQSVTIAAGERVPVRIAMSSGDMVKMDAMVVAGIVEGAGRALNQQRTAANLQSIVSSDAIGQFPDPNIAEALQRVVGIAVERDQGEGRYIQVRGSPTEFSSVTIDGVSVPPTDASIRAVDLDVIPSDVVSSLEVTKALRAEQDADSIGGAINITTQSPFTYDGMRIRGSIGHGYNDYGTNEGDTRGNLMVSNRFGAAKNFGVLLSASYSKTRRKVDNLENVWILHNRPEGGAPIFGLEDIDIKDYDSVRTRSGATASFEWRPTPGHRLFLRGSLAKFNDTEQRNRLQILWAEGTLQPGANDRTATFNNVRLTKQLRDVNRTNQIMTFSAGGAHEFAGMKLDYTAGLSDSKNETPHHREHLYRTPANIRASYDFSSNADLGTYSIFNTGEHLDLSRYQFRENLRNLNLIEEEELSLTANLRKPVVIGERQGALKFGGKIRSKDRDNDAERYRERLASAAPPGGVASVLNGNRSQNYSYFLGNKIDPDKIAPFFLRPFSEYLVPASTTADYKYDEEILAGYGQLDVDYGRLDLFAGLRVEKTEWTGKATSHNTTTNVFTPRRENRSYTDWFPGVHARYAITDMFLLRAALTRAINRPNYRDVIPRRTESEDTSRTTITVSVGNPDLKQTLSNNADLFVEYYFKPMGLISAGIFYKDLTDFRFSSRTRGTFDNLPALITRPENAKGGEIMGFEFAYQQQFTALPGILSGLGVVTNFTATKSEVTAPMFDASTGLSTRFRKVQLPGQSKQTYNLALFYERNGLNARLSYTKRSDYLDGIDVEDGADFDTWWVGRDQLDFTASYQLTRRFQIFAEAKNLTNTLGTRYQGQRRYVTEIEQFGYILFAGVRFTL